MIRVEFGDWHDASHTVDALLAAADRADRQFDSMLARRYRRIADDLGAALDEAIPIPSARTGT